MAAAELEDWFAELDRRIELPLAGLRTVEEIRRSLGGVERLLAARARGNHSTWQEIGDALGISRQAAFSRHGRSSGGPSGTVPVRAADERTTFGS